MTGSAALDILIGLFTLYFVMSTLSSAFVELISNGLGLRAFMIRTTQAMPKNSVHIKTMAAPDDTF